MDADVITFEASRSSLILDSLRENHFETEVGPVFMIFIRQEFRLLKRLSKQSVSCCKRLRKKNYDQPDCGLKTRGVAETDASLRNMVQAAKEIRLNSKTKYKGRELGISTICRSSLSFFAYVDDVYAVRG